MSQQQQPPLSARTLAGEPQHPAEVSDTLAAQWTCDRLTVGGGVAIFHVATARVVVCYHTRGKYWFLPKGRRDAHEAGERGAEREGYEESGYRNRLLPLPLPHRQPTPPTATSSTTPADLFVTEPVWTMLMPLSSANQYLLFWYIAETLPPALEEQLNAAEAAAGGAYQEPPAYPADLTLKERAALEPAGFEPRRHDGTGVNEDEAQYVSFLMTVAEAEEKLKGTVLADVVRKGWAAIELRRRIEEGEVEVVQGRGKLTVTATA